jgi:hypothetical protein
MDRSRANRGSKGTTAASEQIEAPVTAADKLEEALRSLAESETVVGETNAQLQSDREKLERIHRTTKAIDGELEKSNFILRGMSSIFGNMFRKAPKSTDGVRGGSGSAVAAAPSAGIARAAPGHSTEESASSPSVSLREAPALRGPRDAATVREDELLEGISQSLGRLKEASTAAGHEIQSQSAMIDDYAAHADQTRARLDAATRKAVKLTR